MVGVNSSLRLPLSIYAISIVGFFFAFSFQMVTPILPIYSVNNVGADLGEVAAIVAFGFLASAVSKLTAGLIVREGKALRILFFTFIFFTMCNYLYLLAETPHHLMVVRSLHGGCFGVIVTLALSLATFMAGKGFRGKSIGLYTGMVALGLMTGPAVGSIIIKIGGMESVFLILTFIGMAPIFITFLLQSNMNLKPVNLDQKRSLRVFQPIISNTAFSICFLAYLAYAIFYGTLTTYSPIYLNRDLSISPQAVSSIFFGFFFFASMIRFKLSAVVKVIGDKGGLIFGYMNYIFFSLILLMIPGKIPSIISIILIGLSHGIIFPLLATRISRAVPPERLMLANSLYLIAFDVGSLIGPTTTIILARHHSIPLALTASMFPAIAMLPFITLKK